MNTTKGHHGVRCGNCSRRGHAVTHESAEAVRECYALRYDTEEQDRWQIEAEREAERRVESYFEEGTEAQRIAASAEQEYEDRMLGGRL